MAVVAPFRALRYDQSLIAGMDKVVTPPYDVIKPKEQDAFYASEPHNIIRVELNKACDSDSKADNCYTRAAAHFDQWRQSGVLKRDQRPAFYLSETTYTDAEGQTCVRKGYFTRLKVEDFETGVVLPHEKTFTGHKEDRLSLTKATAANISPIFALYPDDMNEVWQVLEGARPATPLAEFVDPMGLPQKLYAVDEAQACRRVQELMADKVIFIADGHHRYETAINYRNHMRELHPQAGPQASFNYVLTYLCSMSDPGLTVFPCHRLVTQRAGFAARDFLGLAEPYFDISEIPASGDLAQDRQTLTAALQEADQTRRCFGLVAGDAEAYYVLRYRDGSLTDPAWRELPEPLRALDVVVMTQVALEHLLGMDNRVRDLVHTIQYLSDMGEVITEVKEGRASVGFLLNPTLVEQVQRVAEAGLIMPRKSTYFYPKVLTGLVINPVDPSEDAADCAG